MSLQAVINPLEFMKKKTGFDGSRTLGEVERERTNTAITPGMIDSQMGQGIPNMGGFDPGDLMARPEIRQEETRNQANMVSAPYEQANRMAAEKTNPMNAESQDPGKVFLMKFIGK